MELAERVVRLESRVRILWWLVVGLPLLVLVIVLSIPLSAWLSGT